MNVNLDLKDDEDVFHVPFKNPVPLTPGVWYTISFAIQVGKVWKLHCCIVSYLHERSVCANYTVPIAIPQGPPILGGNNEPKYEVRIQGKEEALVKFKDATTNNTRNQLPELCFEF